MVDQRAHCDAGCTKRVSVLVGVDAGRSLEIRVTHFKDAVLHAVRHVDAPKRSH